VVTANGDFLPIYQITGCPAAGVIGLHRDDRPGADLKEAVLIVLLVVVVMALVGVVALSLTT
jgi:hypothetical protein